MNSQRENRLAQLIVGGPIAFILGCALIFLSILSMLAMRGSLPIILMGLGCLLVLGGIVMGAIGVFGGHFANRSANARSVSSISSCYVVGRYQINGNGEMVFGDFDFDDPRSKFYVRLKRPDGTDEEYQCAPELIDSVGEGMYGNVQVKGRWLGSFIPLPRER